MTSVELTLALLRAQLDGDYSALEKSEPPSKETLVDIYRLSSSHDLSHMVGAALEKLGFLKDEELASAYTLAMQRAIFRYANQTNVYESVCALFDEVEIPYVPLKGAIIRDLYPSPEMRSACDIDILVHEKDLDRAQSLLIEKLGFERTGKCFHDVSLFLGSVHLELHYNITEDDERLDKTLARAWEFAEKTETSKHKFTNEFFIFHVVAHMCHHFLYGGCGIKPLLDLHLIDKKLSYDKDKLNALLEEASISKFYGELMALSRVWLEGESHSSTTRTLQKYILVGGVYGSSANRIIAQKNETGGRLKYLFRRIFMPKYQLERIYPELKNHPILLPICYVRRWIRVVKKGRGKLAMEEIAYTASMPQNRDKEIEEMLKSLEL